MSSNKKLQLPEFLKVLTSGGLPVKKAMPFAGKVYSQHNTPESLGLLTDSALIRLGVEGKDDRKVALAAFKKAGFGKPPQSSRSGTGNETKSGSKGGTGAAATSTAGRREFPRAVGGGLATMTQSPGAGSSKLKNMMTGKTSSAKKRKRDDDLDELLPSASTDEGAELGSLEFNEVLDEEVLRTKFAVVNRAPVMALWSTIVAEQLGFKREEALSIASAYTEMNAISKGVSLGIIDKSRGKGIEISKSDSQPYIDLMGRRPLFKTKKDSWRALVKGKPVEPVPSYKYITNSFRQTLPYIAGALRLLAESFEPTELNEKGFGIYADFRPEVNEWGKRAEVRCVNILGLRRAKREEVDIHDDVVGSGGGERLRMDVHHGVLSERGDSGQVVDLDKEVEDDTTKADMGSQVKIEEGAAEVGPPVKKSKIISFQESEVSLDASADLDELDEFIRSGGGS